MGQESECTLTYKRRKLAGKAWLETDYILFRGEERLKIALSGITDVQVARGVLKLDFADGPAAFNLGAAAEKWANKILHPPSRLDKLGVKPGIRIAVEGEMEAGFLREISGHLAPADEIVDLLFFAAEHREDLEKITRLGARIKPRGGMWVIYPKGVTAIREIEVIEAGRAAGMKDNKVARFSGTHTALRFALPPGLAGRAPHRTGAFC